MDAAEKHLPPAPPRSALPSTRLRRGASATGSPPSGFRALRAAHEDRATLDALPRCRASTGRRDARAARRTLARTLWPEVVSLHVEAVSLSTGRRSSSCGLPAVHLRRGHAPIRRRYGVGRGRSDPDTRRRGAAPHPRRGPCSHGGCAVTRASEASAAAQSSGAAFRAWCDEQHCAARAAGWIVGRPLRPRGAAHRASRYKIVGPAPPDHLGQLRGGRVLMVEAKRRTGRLLIEGDDRDAIIPPSRPACRGQAGGAPRGVGRVRARLGRRAVRRTVVCRGRRCHHTARRAPSLCGARGASLRGASGRRATSHRG